MRHDLETQCNIWDVQEQLLQAQSNKVLDYKLKVIRDQYIEQNIKTKAMVHVPPKIKKNKKCIIL